jgi:sugar phosphate isomerase/epimerase
MAGNVRVGFSMHPRWAGSRGLEDFLLPLCRVGLSALEFELDDRLEDWSDFEPLMQAAFERGLALSFHAPYRPPHSLVGFDGEGRARIQADYSPLLALAESWAQRSPACRTVVVHAAAGQAPAVQSALAADTQAFLGWVLEAFPDLELALENNHPERPGELKVGVAPQDVLALIAAVGSPRLNACWDLGHDFLRAGAAEPSAEWLAKVVHIHVHDVNGSGEDHYPLVFGNVPVDAWLHGWKAHGGRGSVVLELKGGQLKGWPAEKIGEALELSIAALGKVLA